MFSIVGPAVERRWYLNSNLKQEGIYQAEGVKKSVTPNKGSACDKSQEPTPAWHMPRTFPAPGSSSLWERMREGQQWEKRKDKDKRSLWIWLESEHRRPLLSSKVMSCGGHTDTDSKLKKQKNSTCRWLFRHLSWNSRWRALGTGRTRS